MAQDLEQRPYTTYRAGPRGLRARLRGEQPIHDGGPGGPSGPGDDGGYRRFRGGRFRSGSGFPRDPRRIALRVLKYVVLAAVAWLALSLVVFLLSAYIQTDKLPSSVSAALTSGPNMITGTDTILVIGTDQRPRGSKEAGANTHDAGSRSDTIMLWRIGGGTSRRLSIPRDTVAQIPGHGLSKINAAYAYGGPALTIRTVEALTGVQINHIIIVNLAAFPQFVDAIGGIDIRTGRVCATISGGVQNGGFTLNLRRGVHHLDGRDALTYARMRENACNPSDSDLTRVKHQQEILNAIKSKLLSPSTFFRLPWASWDAPKVLRTDMGGFTLLSLFAAAEMGGTAPVHVLKPTGATTLPDGESGLTVSPDAVHSAVSQLMNG